MTELTQDLSLAQALSLIDSYAFDFGDNNAEQLLASWLNLYHPSWIRLATIEALYRGRYKAVSIEQILSVWSRIGTPNTNFTYEFERLICRKLPKHLSNLSDVTEVASKTPTEKEYPQKKISDRSSNLAATQEITIIEYAKQTVKENDTLNLEKAFSQSHTSTNNIPLISALGFSSTDWSEFTVGHKMIHQFIPLPDVSSFFNKLKTFGEEKLEG